MVDEVIEGEKEARMSQMEESQFAVVDDDLFLVSCE